MTQNRVAGRSVADVTSTGTKVLLHETRSSILARNLRHGSTEVRLIEGR